MGIATTLLSGLVGSLISAIIVGIITYVISKSQIRSLEKSHKDQLKAYEENSKGMIETLKRQIDTLEKNHADQLRAFEDNGKIMVEVLNKQQEKILQLEEKIISLMKTSKDADQKRLELRERELRRRENKDVMERLEKIGKFFF